MARVALRTFSSPRFLKPLRFWFVILIGLGSEKGGAGTQKILPHTDEGTAPESE